MSLGMFIITYVPVILAAVAAAAAAYVVLTNRPDTPEPVEDIPISVCVDCAMVAANADWSGIEDPDREAEIRAGFDNVGGYVFIGDGDPHFSWSACDVCGTWLGGDRLDAWLSV